MKLSLQENLFLLLLRNAVLKEASAQLEDEKMSKATFHVGANVETCTNSSWNYEYFKEWIF